MTPQKLTSTHAAFQVQHFAVSSYSANRWNEPDVDISYSYMYYAMTQVSVTFSFKYKKTLVMSHVLKGLTLWLLMKNPRTAP